jgi:hypothetical protein
MDQESFELDPSARRELVQAIGAHYYNITDPDGQPIGALVVLLDRRQQPVRAELHLHDEQPDEVVTIAVRQAYHILGDRYAGAESLPMQARESFIFGETLRVPLGDPTLVEEPRRRSWWPIAAGAAALVLLIGLYWAFSTLLGRTSAASEDTPASAPIAAAATETPPASQPAPASQPSELPPSKNANPALRIGSRVRISPGYTLTLRSEAGADSGQIVGYMVADPSAGDDPSLRLLGPTAEIVDGPILTQGKSDTIVWWYVRFNEGSEAWAAANTSDVTLLQPAE